MANRKQSRGICKFCGREMTKGGISRHIKACPEREEAIAKADAGKGKVENIRSEEHTLNSSHYS